MNTDACQAQDVFPLIAVDVGNNRMKLGWFEHPGSGVLPGPAMQLQLAGPLFHHQELARWVASLGRPQTTWWIGSVNRPTTTELLEWIRFQRPEDRIVLLTASDLPLEVGLPRPDTVGVDRLLDAVAANRLRSPQRPAVVVDVGSAITVDLVSAQGVFLGGAIMPGIAMAARALHEFTDLLPLLEMSHLGQPPAAVGTATEPAMRAGLFWGAVGGVRQLVAQMAKHVGEDPEVFLTGGASSAVASLLGSRARQIAHLTLAGIALTARHVGPIL